MVLVVSKYVNVTQIVRLTWCGKDGNHISGDERAGTSVRLCYGIPAQHWHGWKVAQPSHQRIPTEYQVILIWLTLLILYLQQIIRVSDSVKRTVQ